MYLIASTYQAVRTSTYRGLSCVPWLYCIAGMMAAGYQDHTWHRPSQAVRCGLCSPQRWCSLVIYVICRTCSRACSDTSRGTFSIDNHSRALLPCLAAYQQARRPLYAPGSTCHRLDYCSPDARTDVVVSLA